MTEVVDLKKYVHDTAETTKEVDPKLLLTELAESGEVQAVICCYLDMDGLPHYSAGGGGIEETYKALGLLERVKYILMED